MMPFFCNVDCSNNLSFFIFGIREGPQSAPKTAMTEIGYVTGYTYRPQNAPRRKTV